MEGTRVTGPQLIGQPASRDLGSTFLIVTYGRVTVTPELTIATRTGSVTDICVETCSQIVQGTCRLFRPNGSRSSEKAIVSTTATLLSMNASHKSTARRPVPSGEVDDLFRREIEIRFQLVGAASARPHRKRRLVPIRLVFDPLNVVVNPHDVLSINREAGVLVGEEIRRKLLPVVS
jgi:hypothetical protein